MRTLGGRKAQATLLRDAVHVRICQQRFASPKEPPPLQKTRIAWTGGKISSNKGDAVAAFIARKRQAGQLAPEDEERLRGSLQRRAAAVVRWPARAQTGGGRGVRSWGEGPTHRPDVPDSKALIDSYPAKPNCFDQRGEAQKNQILQAPGPRNIRQNARLFSTNTPLVHRRMTG